MAITLYCQEAQSTYRYPPGDPSVRITQNAPISLGTYEWEDGCRLWLRKANEGNVGPDPIVQISFAGKNSDYQSANELGLVTQLGYDLAILEIPPSYPQAEWLSRIYLKYAWNVGDDRWYGSPCEVFIIVDGELHRVSLPSGASVDPEWVEYRFTIPANKAVDTVLRQGFSISSALYYDPENVPTYLDPSANEQSAEFSVDGTEIVCKLHKASSTSRGSKYTITLKDAEEPEPPGPPEPEIKKIPVYPKVLTNATIKYAGATISAASSTKPIVEWEPENMGDISMQAIHKADTFMNPYSTPTVTAVAKRDNGENSVPLDTTVDKDGNVTFILSSQLDWTDWNSIELTVVSKAYDGFLKWTLNESTANIDLPRGFTMRETISFKLTANTGYDITAVDVSYNGYHLGEPDLDARNNLDGTWDVTFICNFDFNITAYVEVTTEEKSVGNHTIFQNLNHCKSNLEMTEVMDGGSLEFNDGSTFKVTPDDGYEFADQFDVRWIYGSSTYYGELNDDGTVTVSAPFTGITEDIRIHATATPIEEPSEHLDLGFITVYHPTKEELQRASAVDWYSDEKVKDYIIEVYKTYMKPVDGSAKVPIRYGTFATQVYSYEVVDQYSKIDFGVITLPELYESSLDYGPVTEIELWLPFIGMKSLDVADVMGRPVRLTYRMDVLSGNVMAQLIDELTGTPVGVWTGTCKEDIIFLADRRQEKINDNNGAPAVSMASHVPCFIRRTKIPVDADQSSQLDRKNYKYVRIGDCSGRVVFSDVTVDGIISTSAEKSEIENILKDGVIL